MLFSVIYTGFPRGVKMGHRTGAERFSRGLRNHFQERPRVFMFKHLGSAPDMESTRSTNKTAFLAVLFIIHIINPVSEFPTFVPRSAVAFAPHFRCLNADCCIRAIRMIVPLRAYTRLTALMRNRLANFHRSSVSTVRVGFLF